jgi:prefoldin alpha subunit
MAEKAMHTPTRADLENEERLRQDLLRLKYFESQLQQVQQQITALEAATNELAMTIDTLNSIKEVNKDADSLMPIGSGAFVSGTLKKQDKVLIDVGSGVVVERTVDGAIETLEERKKSIVENAQKFRSMAEGLQKEYNELSGEMKALVEG